MIVVWSASWQDRACLKRLLSLNLIFGNVGAFVNCSTPGHFALATGQVGPGAQIEPFTLSGPQGEVLPLWNWPENDRRGQNWHWLRLVTLERDCTGYKANSLNHKLFSDRNNSMQGIFGSPNKKQRYLDPNLVHLGPNKSPCGLCSRVHLSPYKEWTR